MKAHLMIIDPQNDFMDTPGAALPVPGANEDMKRVAALIDRVGRKLDDVHVTLDSHRIIDVGHPGFWEDRNGKQPVPNPIVIISADDIRNGVWSPRIPTLRRRMIEYAETLESGGKYPLIVYNEHCVIGTPGHNVQSELMEALVRWERRQIANVNYVVKGTNPFTEHYGGLMAEVPDPDDPSTGLNTEFLAMLAAADIIGLAGEALSHCVMSTVNQIADNIGEEHVKKFRILTDCSSPIPQAGGGPDFPAIAASWLEDMRNRGMQLITSGEFLA